MGAMLTLSHLSSEMKKCRGELVSKESDVEGLRMDLNRKASQIVCLEESLQNVKNQLATKSETVLDLEEKLHRCEAERLSCAQQVQTLDGQLQAVRAELTDTLETLKELRDVLVLISPSSAVPSCRPQLGQLDVAIREHKQELERKVESLQQSLEERESQLRAARRDLRDRNTKESQELSQQLCLCQQKERRLLDELQEAQSHCEALGRELDAAKLQAKETEAQLGALEEELALKEAQWLQSEAGLQCVIATLERELELEKEQHNTELDSLQQTRGQLLKVSEQISSTMRSSQEQLTAKLLQSQSQLEQATMELDRSRVQTARLQTQLHQSQERILQTENRLQQSRVQNGVLHDQTKHLSAQLNQSRVQAARLHAQLQQFVESSAGSQLNKEPELIHLQARISGPGRTTDRQNLNNLSLSLPPTEHPVPNPPGSLPTTARSPLQPRSSLLRSPAHTRFSPPTYSNLRDTLVPQVCDGSVDSSLDLPPSLKAVLREAAWEPSSSSSTFTSPLPDTADHSWQGLGAADATTSSDFSFNPLTYMADREGETNLTALEGEDELVGESRRESVSTLVGEEDDPDLGSLTGMLRFVNQTLAKQDDPSVWSSTEPAGS